MKARYISLAPLVDWRKESRPIDWQDVFGNSHPVVLEIGFGNGDFLVRRALKEAKTNFVGVEKEWQSVWRALRRITQNGLSNVRIIKTDARWAIHRLFGTAVFTEIYSLFPCPWPKKRHVPRRLFSSKCFKRLNNSLLNNGVLWVVTDDTLYAQWIIKQAEGIGFLIKKKILSPSFETKYEIKWVKRGIWNFQRLMFTKIFDTGIGPKEDISVRTYKVSFFNPDEFKPKSVLEDVIVNFKDFVYDPKKSRALVRTVVAEDDFVQDLWIEILQNKESWHIRPSPGCGWIPTIGVQKALDAAYEACAAGSLSYERVHRGRGRNV